MMSFGRLSPCSGLLHVLCFAVFCLVLPACAGAAPAQECRLHNPAACNNDSTKLVWAKDLAPAVKAFVAAATPVLPVGLQSYPKTATDILDDFGGPGDGGEKGPGYYIFYGNRAHAAVLKSTIVVSNAGRLLGLAVIEPEGTYYVDTPKQQFIDVTSVHFWFRNGAEYAAVRRKLTDWATKTVPTIPFQPAGTKVPEKQIVVTNVFFVPETAP